MGKRGNGRTCGVLPNGEFDGLLEVVGGDNEIFSTWNYFLDCPRRKDLRIEVAERCFSINASGVIFSSVQILILGSVELGAIACLIFC